MTRPFIAPDWSGKTVAVLASGRSLTTAAIEAQAGAKLIAVRRAVRLAPHADMVLALDAPPNFGFWDEITDFDGLKVCGVECDGLDAMYMGVAYERVTIAPSHEIEIRNNGLAAIRLAAMTGASKIVLVGFDMPYEHFYGAPDADWDGYPGLQQGLEALVAELRAKGFDVERYGL